MNPRVRLATPDDIDAAASVLAAAFDGYPWTRWSIPEDGYADRLHRLQHLYLAHAVDHGLVVVDGQLSAVAAFLPPDTPPPSAERLQLIGELHGDRFDVVTGLTLPAAPPGAWTLATVGVDPATQGTGLGTAVTKAGLAMVDQRAEHVALETSYERNVDLYQRLGFRTVATTTVPNGPVVYSMTRTSVDESGSAAAAAGRS